MFFKCLVLVVSVLDLVQSASLPNSCISTVLPPDPASGCCGVDSCGDKKTPIRQFPWLALLEFRNNSDGSYTNRCNGALISGAYVITTANCLSNEKERNITLTSVILGEYDEDNDIESKDCDKEESGGECTPGAIKIPIESHTSHPQFRKGPFYNDIALIKLSKTVSYTDYIRPVCLPSSDITINAPEDLNLVAAAWGLINRNDSRFNSTNYYKRHINLALWTTELCRRKFWHTLNGEKQMCAGGDGVSGTCDGHGGVPLMYDDGGVYQVVGLDSLGTPLGCAVEFKPEIFTKVFTYVGWFKEVMEDKKEDKKEVMKENTTPRTPPRKKNDFIFFLKYFYLYWGF